MLQLLTQTGQPGQSALPSAEAVPRAAGFNAVPSGSPEALPETLGAFATELDSADELLAEQDAVITADAQSTPVEVPLQADQAPPVSNEPDAEQWLLSMLGQRAVQIQARDGESEQAADESALQDMAQDVFAALSLSANAPSNSAPAPDVVAKAGAALPNVAAVDMALPKVVPARVEPLLVEPQAETPDGLLNGVLERVVSQAGSTPETLASAPTATTPAVTQTATAERLLKLQGPEHKWGEQMLHALRESVELSVQQRVQTATIRLDPPELGSMEIFLSHESGRLSVQISAAQADVARLLQSTSERLRQELVGQNFMQVSVGVSSDGQSGQQHAQQGRARLFEDEAVAAANAANEPGKQGASKRQNDVLITV